MEGTIAEDRVIGRFQKSNSASIQVSFVTWQGGEYVDVREVIPGDQGFIYTRKGVRFKVELTDELMRLLAQVVS